MATEILPEPDYACRLRARPHAGVVILDIPLAPMRPHEARWLADQLIDAANEAVKQEVSA